MRRAAVTALLVVAACGGSPDSPDNAGSSDATTSTTAADPATDDALFTERDDDAVAGEVAATTSPPANEPDVDATTSTTAGDPVIDDENTSGGGASGDTAAGSGTSSTGGESADDGGASSGGGSGAGGTGPDDGSTGGGSSGGAESTGGGDADDGSDSTGSGADGLEAADIDRSVLLDAAELEALGLGTGWFVEVVLEPAVDDGDAPCGLDRLSSVDQLYAPGESADGGEFEQLLVPGLGPDGIAIVRGLPGCAEVTEQLGVGGVVEDLQLGDAAAVVFSIDADELGARIGWYASDVDGLLVFAFHIGEAESRAVVDAAFGQLVADVAAGT